MKHYHTMAFAILIAVATGSARADTVTDWNLTAIEVMKVARVAGNPWSRTLAMVHVSMSDAINAVQGRYTRYIATVPDQPGASAEAAASAAARQILVQLYPNQKAIIEEAYAASVKVIAEGAAKNQGGALGEHVAAATPGDRATAGSSPPEAPAPVTRPRR